MKENTAMNMVRPLVILLAVFLLVINSMGIAAPDVEKTDSAIQSIIDNLAKNENFKVTMEDINFYNILGKNFLVILPGLDMEGNFIRGASGNGDILVYMKKDSNYILVGKLDGSSYEIKEMKGKVGFIKRSHAGGGWEPPTAYELSGETFVESDKYEVSKRNNTEWFDVTARVSSLYDLSDEVTMKTILERALEEGKKKSGHYGYISVHLYQNDKLAVDFEGIADNNLDTTEKVITASKIDNVAKRNQEQIIMELKKGNVSVVRSMIENGTQVEARDIAEWEGDKVNGLTLLMLAACGKDCDVNVTEDDQISLVKYLLSKGADVNAYVPWGESVLTYAVGQGSEEKTEEETKGGASHLPIVKLLLEHGAKTKVGAAYEHIMGGNTSLTKAAIHGYYQIVSLLFQYDAQEGLYQAYKFAKENNHNQTAKMIHDKFWSNYKSGCLTNSGFSKSLMIGDPVDTENYAISIVQGKRTTSDSYISTAICIFDKINEKTEFAEPSAFKKFPFALAALSQNKDKQLQQNNQTSFCNEARQLLSKEPVLPINNKSVDCIFNSKFISTIVIGEPTDTESYKIFITQGAHSVTDDNISTAICIFNKNKDAIDLIEPNIFKTYPFALSAFNTPNNNLVQLANDQLTCNDEIKQLLNGYIKDDKLTRGKAKRLIDEYFAIPNGGENVTIGIGNLRVHGCNRQSPPYRGMSDLDACYQITAQKGYGSSYNSVKAAVEHGFIIVSVVGYQKGNSSCGNDLICNTLVAKTGQPFFWRSQTNFFGDIGTINTGRHKVVEILGVFKDSENVARIDFTFKIEPTDIGVLDSRTGIFSTALKKRYAELHRYDDGWRVNHVCCIGLWD